MPKILVPTDFSINSKAGIRFALQWSLQQKLTIQFIHFFHTRRLPQWTDAEFKINVDREAVYFTRKLEQFIRAVYKSTNIVPGKYNCLAKYGLSADIAIMDFCRDQSDIQFICISTRGAGKLNKLLGTHTGNLTTHSSVPVITVPKNYRMKPIKNILYASDFSSYTKELKKVVAVARPLGANIHVLHVSSPDEIIPDVKWIKKAVKDSLHYVIDLQIEKRRSSQSLLKDLQMQIYRLNPSLIIMFTDQHRNFFQKLLSPSKVEQLSFRTPLPLLSFNKE
jgi:nucleotide-binding universal stress UspA family protein